MTVQPMNLSQKTARCPHLPLLLPGLRVLAREHLLGRDWSRLLQDTEVLCGGVLGQAIPKGALLAGVLRECSRWVRRGPVEKSRRMEAAEVGVEWLDSAGQALYPAWRGWFLAGLGKCKPTYCFRLSADQMHCLLPLLLLFWNDETVRSHQVLSVHFRLNQLSTPSITTVHLLPGIQ